MNSRILVIGLCLSLAVVVIGGCGNDSNPAAPKTLTATDITQAVQLAGKSQPLGPDKDVIIATEVFDQDGFRNVVQTHDAARNVQDIACVSFDNTIIWPGNLLKGATLHQFALAPVAGVERDAIHLSIRLENSTRASDFKPIDRPDLETVSQGVHDLLVEALDGGATFAPRIQFEHTQVYNASHANLVAGADLTCGAGSANTAFDWASTTRENKLIGKFEQLYYTVAMDKPGTPADFFAAGNTIEGVRSAIPSGSCPVYASEVGYGLMALTFVETDYTPAEMNAALEAAYRGQSLIQEIRTGLTLEQVLHTSGIRTVVYGGSSAGLGQVENGYAGLMRVIRARLQLGATNPGAPVTWTLRHLCDNGVAKATLTSQYTVTKLIPRGPIVRYPS
jgi:hypothetical protein